MNMNATAEELAVKISKTYLVGLLKCPHCGKMLLAELLPKTPGAAVYCLTCPECKALLCNVEQKQFSAITEAHIKLGKGVQSYFAAIVEGEIQEISPETIRRLSVAA